MQIKRALVMVGLAWSAVGCSAVSVDAGHQAVLVSKPWFFGHGGVSDTPISTGRTYVALSTEAIVVDMRPIQWNVEFDDLMSRDGVPLDFNASVRLKINDSVKLVQYFGADAAWFSRNVEQPFRNAVRDSVKRRGMNEMAIDASASEAVDAEVSTKLQAVIAKDGLPVTLIDVTLGRANPPDAIKHQRIDTATQEQRIQTEKQTKLAEDQRLEAERARAMADNAYREAMRLSPDQFLQLESIKAMREVCGGGKCSIVTAGALPTFGIQRQE
jgi:regulator of protease activity HflC (stomatin/prohibitin superfamily)